MRWLPIEANPDVLNKYLEKLGTKGSWKFHDVLGLDEKQLNTITGQVAAVLLLFPKSEAELEKKLGHETTDDTVIVIKQTAEQACGSVAILHALINNNELIPVEPGSQLDRLANKIRKMTPVERGQAVEQDKNLFDLHETMAKEGQTRTPAREHDVDQLYVCFIHHKGHLYELDGQRERPISHGKTTETNLLQDTAKVIRNFVERDTNKVNFSVLVLSS
ncbi:Ubiquitin carboxyl-terminal hydrolase [Fasciola hepatica]|uniref:Ubiquitin carboxyl-terminal hydrolase n=1 Tax=Fasciola hepatica TaxID=6192 RepID=A0A4E0RJB5_FASHE|nr:Ubiquitin carboxyl-terminal hydrolase [Fasciola hepatica]